MYVKTLATVALGLCMVLAVQMASAAQQATTHDGTVVSAGSGKLDMTGEDGKEHSHMVDAKASITVHGKTAKLEDLQKGMKIHVTTDHDNKVTAVATVEKTK